MRFGSLHKLGVLFVGVLKMMALLLRVYTRPGIFGHSHFISGVAAEGEIETKTWWKAMQLIRCRCATGSSIRFGRTQTLPNDPSRLSEGVGFCFVLNEKARKLNSTCIREGPPTKITVPDPDRAVASFASNLPQHDIGS